MCSISASLTPLIPFKSPPEFCAKSLPKVATVRNGRRKLAVQIYCTRLDESSQDTSATQQLNLSVLRFTFGNLFNGFLGYMFCSSLGFKVLPPFCFGLQGIPGLDESYLPRWIGYAFGSLLLLNHFLGSDSTTVTSAQLVRSFISWTYAILFG